MVSCPSGLRSGTGNAVRELTSLPEFESLAYRLLLRMNNVELYIFTLRRSLMARDKGEEILEDALLNDLDGLWLSLSQREQREAEIQVQTLLSTER